jgi:hypothetical protein
LYRSVRGGAEFKILGRAPTLGCGARRVGQQAEDAKRGDAEAWFESPWNRFHDATVLSLPACGGDGPSSFNRVPNGPRGTGADSPRGALPTRLNETNSIACYVFLSAPRSDVPDLTIQYTRRAVEQVYQSTTHEMVCHVCPTTG